MASDSKVVLQRKSSKNATTKELMEQATMFISFMPGVTEILFYYVLMAVVKPFLILQRIYPNFMLALIGPSGHLKTTLARLFAMWLEQEELQEMAFADVAGQSVLDDRIKKLQGQNLIIDDMHVLSGNYRRNKQTDLLDYLSRHCDSKKVLANLIVTGEMIPSETIFSVRDRMFQVRIAKMNADELRNYKHNIRKLPENFMAQLSERFAHILVENSNAVGRDICMFHEQYREPEGLDCTTRISMHVECMMMVEFLYTKYFCENQERVSMKSQFIDSLNRQARCLHGQLCNQRKREEVVDYVEVVYEMIVEMALPNPKKGYKPEGDEFAFQNGKFYITKTALQKGILTYLNRTVSMRAVSDALHDAGVIEEDISARTKKFHGTRHYVISKQAIETYCQIKKDCKI